jgi:hypothetical protein
MREEIEPDHILDIHDRQHGSVVGRPAGIFWLDGRCVMAAHDTIAEARLLEIGAILVGTLRFDPDPLESVHPGVAVERVASADLAEAPPLPGLN